MRKKCRELQKNDAVDFSDIISYAVALLSKDKVREYYNNKLAHVMIDEFQVSSECACKVGGFVGNEHERFSRSVALHPGFLDLSLHTLLFLICRCTP
jgi:hypothetical protein